MTTKLKIAHLSDTHLGYRTGGITDPSSGRNQRSVDFERSFSSAVTMILLEEPDLIVHAGDVFHHPRPDWRAVRCFIDEWRKIENAGIPSLVISGNHDVSRLRTIGSVYDVLRAALPKTRFVVGQTIEQIAFDEIKTMMTAVPYVPEGHIPLQPLASMWNILVSHGGVKTNLSDPDMRWAAERDPWFDPIHFDYVALGDHHLSYRVADKTWYSGSTERCGFSDERASPGILSVELEKGKTPAITHYAVLNRPMKTLVPVTWGGILKTAIDDVVELVEFWNEPAGIARVELVGGTHRDAAEVQRFATSRLRGKVWSLRVYTGKMLVEEAGGILNQTVDQGALDVKKIFQEFVDQRADKDPKFWERMRTQGGAALDRAYEKEHEEMNVEGA